MLSLKHRNSHIAVVIGIAIGISSIALLPGGCGRRQMITTSLHLAVEQGDIGKVRQFLKSGADPNAPNERGETPLHLAVKLSRPEIASLLINAGGDPNGRDQGGRTPLHFAARAGKKALPLTELLIASGADVNAETKEGDRPVEWARVSVDHDVLRLLFESGGTVTDQKPDPFRAAFMGDIAVLRECFHRGLSPNAEAGDWCLVHWAVAGGHVDILKTLKTAGADLAKEVPDIGLAPLHVGVMYRQHEAVEWLLQQGTPVNVEDPTRMTPLHYASRPEGEEGNRVMELLLAAGADPSKQDIGGATALHRASVLGDEAGCRLLIGAGAKVNATDKRGRTPLVYAVRHGHLDVVRLLVKHGADTVWKKEDGADLVDLARSEGHGAVADFLGRLTERDE